MNQRLVILASGTGSLAQAIIEAGLNVVALICDQPSAFLLERFKHSGIQVHLLPMEIVRSDWDRKLIAIVHELKPDLVISAGFMRVLSPEFVADFKVINSHPALLPLFPGAHAIRDAIVAGVQTTGATVHWVDAGVDTGEIIDQVEVQVLPQETEAVLHERIKEVERVLLVNTIKKLLANMEPHV